MSAILGLDIGGANLKAAHSDGTARARPFALWKAPAQLAAQLRTLRAQMPPHDRLAVTMTGELCDCFPTRRDGVCHILGALEEAAGPTPVWVWTTRGRFVDVPTARRAPLDAASANWLALAHLIGLWHPGKTGLVIDTGSTTTDLIYLDNGIPRPRGLTDRDRLRCGELVYTGVRRTPVCAVLGMDVAAEFFATMLDAYLVLRLTSDDPTDTDTADGRPATAGYAHARLARLLCADAQDVPAAEIRALAARAVRRQEERVMAAVDQVLDGRPDLQYLFITGSGRALGYGVARHPRLTNVPQDRLSSVDGPARWTAVGKYESTTSVHVPCQEADFRRTRSARAALATRTASESLVTSQRCGR